VEDAQVSLDHAQRIGRALQIQLVNAVLGNERIAREFGLLVTDLQTLHLMLLREDVRTPRQLSAVSGLPTSTVTRVIDRLEAAGYVRRVNDPTDRRRTNLELVPEKIAPIVEHYVQYSKAYADINEEFTPEELAIVARYLERISVFF
jgi:DNA-binding MarR family transcriptional regulator